MMFMDGGDSVNDISIEDELFQKIETQEEALKSILERHIPSFKEYIKIWKHPIHSKGKHVTLLFYLCWAQTFFHVFLFT